MQEIFLLREALVIIATGAAAYSDFKTGYIYDKITYPLIAIGLILNIFEQQYAGIGLAAAIFIFGWGLYKTGKIGGGDVKLYAGIAMALPFFGQTVFILPVILFSALCGLVFVSAYYVVKYAKKGIDFELNRQGILHAILLFAVVILYFIVASGIMHGAQAFIYAMAIPLLLGSAFLALERGIKKEFFLKKIRPEEADDDEVIALDFISAEQKLKAGKLKPVMTREEILALKKHMKEILVYRDLPRFGPFIFIGVLMALAILNIYPELGLFKLGL